MTKDYNNESKFRNLFPIPLTYFKGTNKIEISANNKTYLIQSQCILAVRIPGKTNIAPVTAHQIAKQNFKINLDAGPLKMLE